MKAFKIAEKQLTVMMNKLATFAGRPAVFAVVLIIIIGWFVAGLFIEYDTWFDIMDVAIFVTTFFLLFVVQASQNADTRAIQDKLDEIIDSIPQADTHKEHEEKRIKRGDEKGE